MADTYIQACFAFLCSQAEWDLLHRAFLISIELANDVEPEPPTADFARLFPPVGDDPWAGFRTIFLCGEYPEFGCDLEGDVGPAGNGRLVAIISAEMDFVPEAVAKLIQRCCAETLNAGPIGFEWSVSCSRQRVGAFGGGWCAIFDDWIELQWTSAGLAAALADPRL